jgi:hypothetical protein
MSIQPTTLNSHELQSQDVSQTNNRFYIDTSPSAIKLKCLALAIFSIYAISNIPVAMADKYTDCIENCDRTADNGLPRMICYGLCALLNAFVK